MLPIPPEVLEDMSLKDGHKVSLSYEEGVLRIEPSAPRPSQEAVEFMSKFVKEYDEAMSNLAHR